VIKVAGEPSSDEGDEESENANWEAGGTLEYRNQESKEDEATYKRIAVSKADHPYQFSYHTVAWMKTVTHQKNGRRAPAARTGTFGCLHRDGGLHRRNISTVAETKGRGWNIHRSVSLVDMGLPDKEGGNKKNGNDQWCENVGGGPSLNRTRRNREDKEDNGSCRG